VTHKKPSNLAASVRQRLMNVARQQGEDFQLVLTRYLIERLLYRLAQSPHAERFLLKGAMLFTLWTGRTHRPTRDLDLLGRGDAGPEALGEVFRDLCSLEVEPDGAEFAADTLEVEAIREDQEYQGQRVHVEGRLGNARVRLQVDVGVGDTVTPGPQHVRYPTLLEMPAPELKAYPKETVVAEKLQAMVMLGMANSRMKDFFDLSVLAREFEFEGPILCQAIEATFKRRGTEIPAEPIALTVAFTGDAAKQTQWKAFLRRSGLDGSLDLASVVTAMREFLLRPLDALRQGRPFESQWSAGGPWSDKELA
jgi:predicted nucleotidyltransferase component of viral defense system